MVHRTSIKIFVRVVTEQIETLAAAQRCHDVAQLVLKVVRVGDGLRDLVAEQLAKPLAQPMDGGPGRDGADAERRGDFAVGNGAPLRGQELFQSARIRAGALTAHTRRGAEPRFARAP